MYLISLYLICVHAALAQIYICGWNVGMLLYLSSSCVVTTRRYSARHNIHTILTASIDHLRQGQTRLCD